MVRPSAIAVLLVTALLMVVPSVVLSPAAPADAQEVAIPSIDHELHQALADADLVDEWVDASGISAAAALANVTGTDSYQASRDVLLDDLRRLAERREHIDGQAERAELLTNDVVALEDLTRSLRRTVASAGRRAAVSLTPRVVAEARVTLNSIFSNRRLLGVSFDPLTLVERRLTRSRDELEREVDALARMSSQSTKTVDGMIARLTAVHTELQHIQSLITTTTQRSGAFETSFAAQRATLSATMPTLHEARLLQPTGVGGLPVVTLDAYVRGASGLDESCPVDWALLAGIGRVESRHGTIDDTTVQRSGRVSKPILGPLLDGGATEREAAESAAAAAEAEEALLLAEAEAEREAAEAEAAAFEALVWGDDVAEDTDGSEEGDEAETENQGTPRYDPLLWGDDLPFADDDFVDEDDEADEDDEEPEFRGNGFAVIADSDDGRLDGNSRWDRAVGPMQFIPETWSYWETDGNADGVIDPQNLYDAAATAGRFLCHLSRNRGPSPHTFVLGYNSSQTYVRNVMAVANAFGATELPGVDG